MLRLTEDPSRPYGINPAIIEVIRRQVALYQVSKVLFDQMGQERDVCGSPEEEHRRQRDNTIVCGIFADAETSLISSILAFNEPNGMDERGFEPKSIVVDGILYVAHPVQWSHENNADGKPDFELSVTPIADVVVIPTLAA